MANGKRERVGGVVELYFAQPENTRRHRHDLLLLRPAVADDRLLHLKRSVFAYRHIAFACGEQYHTARYDALYARFTAALAAFEEETV